MFKKNFKVFWGAVILLAFFLPGYIKVAVGLEPQIIGSIIMTQGTVTAVNSANESRPLERKSNIYLNDKIVTGPNSKVQLRLTDDSIIALQADSIFYVNDYKFNKSSPSDNRYVGNIVKGALINISGVGETNNYQLKSPMAVIAFRGTGIATKIFKDNVGVGRQEVFVFDGKVSVLNACKNCATREIIVSATDKNNAILLRQIGAVTNMNVTTFTQLSIGRDKNLTKSGANALQLQCRVRTK
jgi:hypothetical protein